MKKTWLQRLKGNVESFGQSREDAKDKYHRRLKSKAEPAKLDLPGK